MTTMTSMKGSCGCEHEPHTCDSETDLALAEARTMLDAITAARDAAVAHVRDVERDRDERLAALARGEQCATKQIDELVDALVETRHALDFAQETLLEVATERDRWQARVESILDIGARDVAEIEAEIDALRTENRTIRRQRDRSEFEYERISGLGDVMLGILERSGQRGAATRRLLRHAHAELIRIGEAHAPTRERMELLALQIDVALGGRS